MLIQRILLSALLAGCFLVSTLRAADPTFVGVLALAVDDDVAKQIGLEDDVKTKLLALIDMREDEVLKSGLDQLPDDEKKAKLAAFAAESEKLGLALLSKEQQTKLMQLRIARDGLSTLQDASVAEAIGLDKAQQSHIEKLMASLKTKLVAGTEKERAIAKAELERGLSIILKKDQRAAWDKLAGIAAGDAEEKPAVEKPVPEKDPAETKPDEEEKPVKPETKPGTTKPETTKPDTSKKPELSKPKTPKNIDDVRLGFNFSYTPYKNVLEWLAEEADLSLVGDNMPPGTFNYKDNRKYTVPQAIDLINKVLLTRGYTLVRHERLLFVFNVEDGLPPHFTKTVTPKELDGLGEFEMVGCLFAFSKATPEDVEADVRRIVGPQSSVIVLAKSKQMYVQETAGKLKTIRAIIETLETTKGDVTTVTIKFKHKTSDEILGTARPLMGIPEGLNSTPDGFLRIAPVTNGFIVQGKQELVDRFKELVETLDVESEGETPDIELPQIVVYSMTSADPDAVLLVLQTVMAGQLNVRIAKDPKSGNIVAHGTPTQHATMKALIDEMQKDPRDFDVIKLRKLDPELVVASLNKILGIVEGAPPNASQPRLVADATQMLVMVFGSKRQIEQVREAIMKMGEAPATSDPTTTERSYQRVIGLTGRLRASALEQITAIAPVYIANPIRVVPLANTSESGEIPSRVPVPKDLEKRMTRPLSTPSSRSSDPREDRGDDERSRYDRYRDRGDRDRDDERRPDGERRSEGERRSQRIVPRSWQYVAWQDPELKPEPKQPAKKSTAAEEAPATNEEAPDEKPEPEETKPKKQKSVPGAEVVITVTPSGIILSSEDLDALDQMERIFQDILEQQKDGGKEYTIFYLRHAKADVAADLLTQALGGGSGDDGGGGGSIMGDIASSMFGGGGGMGGLMGAMMGGSGGGSSSVSSGPVLLIPDNRLNAILAQGKPSDLDLAELLLKIIDQQASKVPVEIIAKPRFIPVYHTTADEMATTIRQVYANRMAADPGAARQPSPQELMQALRGGGGGRGGRGGAGNDRKSEEQKMTIGVDAKSNSLIVSAPPALFEEISDMVKDLDIASTTKDEFIGHIKTSANTAMFKNQLSSILGEGVEVTVIGSSSSTTSRPQTARNNATRPQGQQGQQPGAQQQPQFNPQQIQSFIQGQGGQRGGGGGGQRGGGGGGQRGGR